MSRRLSFAEKGYRSSAALNDGWFPFEGLGPLVPVGQYEHTGGVAFIIAERERCLRERREAEALVEGVVRAGGADVRSATCSTHQAPFGAEILALGLALASD